MRTLLRTGLVLALFGSGRIGGAAAQLPPAGDPPYIPTPQSLVDLMLDMARVGPGDVVYDLGAGDGRVAISAAQRGARGVGVEYVQWLVQRSWARADSAGVRDRVDFIHGDVFEADVSDASVVTLYLGADFNRRLRPRLLEQLRPGSRIVSHGFHMGEWEPDRTHTVGEGAERATLYYWVVPARVDGFWLLEVEGLPAVSVELRQEFQEFEVRVGGPGDQPPSPGRVIGEAVRFTARIPSAGQLTEHRFRGRMDGDALAGYADGEDGKRRSWRAVRFSDLSGDAWESRP